MLTLERVTNRKIILDTGIAVLYSVAGFKEASGNILRKLVTNGNSLAISEISILELLSAPNLKDKTRSYLESFVNYVNKLPVHRYILENGALLSRDYEKICDGRKIPLPDLIIGGTMIALRDHKPLFLTTDRNDFSDPFWKLFAYSPVKFGEGPKKKCYHLYLVEFNEFFLDFSLD